MSFVDDDDVMLGRAAVRVLNELSGRKRPLPTSETKKTARAEWESWLRTRLNGLFPLMLSSQTAAEVERLLPLLSNDDPAVREQADQKLRISSLRHAARLRRALEAEPDTEARSRLAAIVTRLPELECMEAEVIKYPILILQYLKARPLKKSSSPDLVGKLGQLYTQLVRSEEE